MVGRRQALHADRAAAARLKRLPTGRAGRIGRSLVILLRSAAGQDPARRAACAPLPLVDQITRTSACRFLPADNLSARSTRRSGPTTRPSSSTRASFRRARRRESYAGPRFSTWRGRCAGTDPPRSGRLRTRRGRYRPYAAAPFGSLRRARPGPGKLALLEDLLRDLPRFSRRRLAAAEPGRLVGQDFLASLSSAPAAPRAARSRPAAAR